MQKVDFINEIDLFSFAHQRPQNVRLTHNKSSQTVIMSRPARQLALGLIELFCGMDQSIFDMYGTIGTSGKVWVMGNHNNG